MSEGSLEAEASLFGGRVAFVTVTGADYLFTNIQNLNLSQNHLIIGEVHTIPTDPGIILKNLVFLEGAAYFRIIRLIS